MSVTSVLFQICFVLVLIGALNWGLYALSPSNDLVQAIFPSLPAVRTILYGLIGLSSIIAAYIWLAYPSSVVADCSMSPPNSPNI